MKHRMSALLGLLLCAALAVPVLAMGYGGDISPEEKTYQQTFEDVPADHWAFAYVAEMAARGAVNGYPDGLFRPSREVTRAEFAKIMLGAAGLEAKPVSVSSFSDVPTDNWASPFVETAKPYLTAYTDGTYRPSVGASREDIAVAVVLLKGYDLRLADLSLLDAMFSDVAAISVPLRPYIALAVENGLVSGYPDGTFRAQGTITRAEASAVLWRAFQYGNDDKVLAEAVPAALPSPSPSPAAASPSPTSAQEFAGYVETVQKMPSGSSAYVLTGTGEVYFIRDNKLYFQSGGTAKELFDGNQFYEEYTGSQIAGMVKAEPEEYYSDDYYHPADIRGGESSIAYFDKLTLSHPVYDQRNGKVYVCGTTDLIKGFLASAPADDPNDYYVSHSVFIQRIYDVSDMETPLCSWVCAPRSIGGQDYNILPAYLICLDSSLYFPGWGVGCLKIDTASGTSVVFGGNGSKSPFDSFRDPESYFILDGKIARWEASYRSGLSTLNLSTGAWENVSFKDVKPSFAAAPYRNRVYFTTAEGLDTLEPAGTNRMTGKELLTWGDLEVRDGIPMGKAGVMLFDGRGCLLFTDTEHSLVRTITFTKPI